MKLKYTALGGSLVTNIALWLRLVLYLPLDSPRAVYFIQTGSSTLSNIQIMIHQLIYLASYQHYLGQQTLKDICVMSQLT